jgi:hypothetical protein
MKDPVFAQPENEFNYGLRMLRDRSCLKAVRHFRKAVDTCPVERRGELSRYLYWLGIALQRLGKPELALKSVSSSRRLVRRGFSRKLYSRMANGYGMLKRRTSELDDLFAFRSIQIAKYLERKPSRCFSSEIEKAAVEKLVGETWSSVKGKELLEGRSTGQKIELFNGIAIRYPAFFSAEPRASVLPGKFGARWEQRPDERCACGSGLPFRQCCGRLACRDEIEYGYF